MNANEVREFFKNHWTVRRYKTDPIPSEHVDVMLYAAQRAPTDATAQMGTLIQLEDSELRTKIAELSMNPHIAVAPLSFVVCADIHRLKLVLQSAGKKIADAPKTFTHFAIGDAVLMGQNLVLAAEMLGYRCCWIGGVLGNYKQICTLLKLPDGVFPFAALTVGVPDEDPVYRPRLERELAVMKNQYDLNESLFLSEVKRMGAITKRGDWAQTLTGYFGEGSLIEGRESKLAEVLGRITR